jgi:hypothetical protein
MTADSGYLAKQLAQAAHRLMVTALDREEDDGIIRGFPVDIDDEDNEGGLLAVDVAGYDKNTFLTPKILRDLKERGVKRLLLRSPVAGGTPEGGVYARDVGIRERGGLPGVGEQVGLTAAQALSEPLSQAMLSSKHAGGVAGASATKTVGGFDAINQLVQVPEVFRGAAHSTMDGSVERIENAPAGGQFITVGNKKHYVPPDHPLKVKIGDKVEAGDVLSDGVPNPAIITMYKGIGEGRRYFVKSFRDTYKSAGIKAHRRNIELLSRGLINHVRLTGEVGGGVPDDVIPYSVLEHNYEPRDGFRELSPDQAVGKYLERPVLHYSIGTKIRPSMMHDFNDFGVKAVTVHDEEPPFEAEMVRGMTNLTHDQDWMTKMLGSGLKGSLVKAVNRGATSDPTGTSYVPALAQATTFGRQGLVRTPKPTISPAEAMKIPGPPKKPGVLGPMKF